MNLLAGCLPPTRNTRLAIGDDAAAVEWSTGELLLVTTDLLMEDVHFRLAWDDLPALGWKALAQNLSDIAAMGGVPTHAVIAIALPDDWTPQQVVALYQGLGDLAARTHVDIAGGDTNRSSGPLTLSLTVIGRVHPAAMITRAGAHPGDALYVTGTLGRAAAGFRVLETQRPYPESLTTAVQAQLRPQPRLEAGRALGESHLVTAMMDLSDGVATDLHRLCRASGVGAIVDRDMLPVDPSVIAAVDWLAGFYETIDPCWLALAGGEDFELLLTAPVEHEEQLRACVAPLSLTRIGTLTDSTDILLAADGQLSPLPWGFTHFS